MKENRELIIAYIVLIIIAFAVSSCQKDVLEPCNNLPTITVISNGLDYRINGKLIQEDVYDFTHTVNAGVYNLSLDTIYKVKVNLSVCDNFIWQP